MTMAPVQDNKERNRYELRLADDIAFINYRRANGIVTLLHAEVPARHSGRGIGSAMVKGALEQVRADGERVLPLCSFVAAYIDRHAEVQDLLARK